MNINEQERIINFMYKHNLSCDVTSRVLDLSAEVGKLGKMVLKNTNYGKEQFKSSPELNDQLGEIYLVILELANEMGVHLEDVFKRAVERNDLKLSDKENN